MPAAIAPEETKTTSRPLGRDQPARASTSASMRVVSMAPAGVVSEEDPALTTMRRASRMAVRISDAAFRESQAGIGREHPSDLPTRGSSALQAQVGAAAAETGVVPGEHFGLPVKDDRVLLGADEHGR